MNEVIGLLWYTLGFILFGISIKEITGKQQGYKGTNEKLLRKRLNYCRNRSGLKNFGWANKNVRMDSNNHD